MITPTIKVEFPDNIKLAELKKEVRRLNELRVKEVDDHEDAMRVLIKIIATRGDIIRNAKERADNWKKITVRLGRKNRILESRIRHDNRTFLYGNGDGS